MTLRGHFFLKKKGSLSKNRKVTSLFIAKSWRGHMLPVPPVPMSMQMVASKRAVLLFSRNVKIEYYDFTSQIHKSDTVLSQTISKLTDKLVQLNKRKFSCNFWKLK